MLLDARCVPEGSLHSSCFVCSLLCLDLELDNLFMVPDVVTVAVPFALPSYSNHSTCVRLSCLAFLFSSGWRLLRVWPFECFRHCRGHCLAEGLRVLTLLLCCELPSFVPRQAPWLMLMRHVIALSSQNVKFRAVCRKRCLFWFANSPHACVELDFVDLCLCQQPFIFWYFPQYGVRRVLDVEPNFLFHTMERELQAEICYSVSFCDLDSIR